MVRLAFGLPQREIVTVTTNVPGPRQPLYGMGRRLVEIIPYVPIATTLRTGIAIFTYCGTVTFGITGDFTATPTSTCSPAASSATYPSSWSPPSAARTRVSPSGTAQGTP